MTARCEPVDAMGDTVGAFVRLDAQPPASSGKPAARGRRRPRRETFGWGSLSDAQLGTADLVAAGLYVSPHTVDSHLRQIYVKLGIRSRVDLTRMVSENSANQPDGT